MAETDLQKRLEALGRRLVEDIEAWEKSTREQRREAITHLTEHVSQQIEKAVAKERTRRERRREERREHQLSRREARRQQQMMEASVGAGVISIIAALAFLAFAIIRPDLWWMIFIALGLGTSGARQFNLVASRKRLERGGEEEQRDQEEERRPKADDPVHEVDVLCDQLLADLKAAPEAVRQFVQAPEKTIASLRATARALDARRRQLLAEQPKERLAGLDEQRRTLKERRDGAVDELTRKRLDDALRSLDGQQKALEQLSVAAERVDGEYTSLLVSLQELRTRVSVAKTAGSAVQLEGLKSSVTRLNGELEAITEALESVSREGVQPVAPVTVEDARAPGETTRERT